jgi:GNAT superfamily N-acetyltransferase
MLMVAQARAQLVLRSAQPDDAMQIAGVHVRSWQVAYRGLLPDSYLDGLRPEDRARRSTLDRTEPDQPHTIVAISDRTLVGFASIGPAHSSGLPDVGELYAIYVDPPWWKRGIGRALMAEARARLAQGGFAHAVLWVLVGNERAQRFYLNDGWCPDGERRVQQVWGIAVDEIRYGRALNLTQTS